jgi:hypothetical protein
MHMKKVCFTFLSFAFVFFSAPYFAQALTVSPARIEISGDPGQTLTGEIVLFDEGDSSSSKEYYISFENFEPRGDSGAPYFIGAKDGLATWISAPSQVIVNGQTETKVPFSISIPPSTKPGGFFSSIFFGTQPIEAVGNSQVSVGGKVGVLILLRVNGEIEEGGGLVSFNLKDEKKIITNVPIILEYRFNNTGGDRVVPKGTISLYNTFRFKTDEIDANKNTGSVLPGSARRFEVLIGDETPNTNVEMEETQNFFSIAQSQWKDFRFGWYTAKLSISWGQTNQTAVDSYHFFVIPWQILIIISAGLFLIFKIFGIILRRYNRWILKQAGLYQQNVQTPPVQQVNDSVPILNSSPKRNKETIVRKKQSTTKPLQKPKRKI